MNDLLDIEKRYKIIFENNVIGICQVDYLTGKYLIMNPYFAKLFGYSSQEEMIKNIENVRLQIDPEIKNIFEKFIESKGEITNYEVQLKRKNGDKWWGSINVKSIRDEHNNISCYECFVEDITDKKDNIDSYKSLLNAIPDMMTRIRKDGLVMDVKPGEGIFYPSQNGQSVSMIGHMIDELPFGEVIIDEFKKIIREVIEKGVPIEFCYSIKINEQDRHFYSRTVKNNDNEVVVIVRDTTEETNTSIELKYSKEYAENLINTANLMVVSLDINGNVIGFNNRAEEITGYKREEIIGKNWFENIVPKEVFPEAWNEFEKIVSKNYTPNFENPILTKNGEIRHILWRNNVTEDKGKVKGTISFGMDITDHKKLEEELRIAKEKAEQSDKMKLEYLANMSHDLRTPMTAIVGLSDLLRTNNLSKTDKQEYITTIINNGKYLMALIDDIIDISKIDAGTLKIEIKDFELNKLMEELRLSYLKQIKDKNIEIIIDIDVNKNIIINSDKYRLRQIMANLIGNAIKFTNDGYVKFGYRILNGKQLEIYVEDTGIGIEKKNHKVIFERFRQINNTSKNKGAGLGLSIAKSLIELLGWKEIKLISEIGKGSRFYFIIPFAIKHFNYMNEMKSSKHKKINLRGKTILVVEDNYDSRTIIKSYLHETYANIVEMLDGFGVMDYIKNNKVDLILLDIGLPGKDGYTLLEEIRNYDARLPVIIESALVMLDQKNKAFELGADDFISKPYNKEDFLNKIDNLI
jgi:PAS domain S-box-containing protein